MVDGRGWRAEVVNGDGGGAQGYGWRVGGEGMRRVGVERKGGSKQEDPTS